VKAENEESCKYFGIYVCDIPPGSHW
jgi:hypothetical protein